MKTVKARKLLCILLTLDISVGDILTSSYLGDGDYGIKIPDTWVKDLTK